MRGAELTERIALQRSERTYGAGGVPTTEWVTTDTVWAGVSALAGFEYYAARSAQSGIDYEIVIRYPLPSGMLPRGDWRILWRGAAMNITAAPVMHREAGGLTYYIIRASAGDQGE